MVQTKCRYQRPVARQSLVAITLLPRFLNLLMDRLMPSVEAPSLQGAKHRDLNCPGENFAPNSPIQE